MPGSHRAQLDIGGEVVHRRAEASVAGRDGLADPPSHRLGVHGVVPADPDADRHVLGPDPRGVQPRQHDRQRLADRRPPRRVVHHDRHRPARPDLVLQPRRVHRRHPAPLAAPTGSRPPHRTGPAGRPRRPRRPSDRPPAISAPATHPAPRARRSPHPGGGCEPPRRCAVPRAGWSRLVVGTSTFDSLRPATRASVPRSSFLIRSGQPPGKPAPRRGSAGVSPSRSPLLSGGTE